LLNRNSIRKYKPLKFTKPRGRIPSDLISYLNTKELDDPFIRKIAEITNIGKK
jgi:hypothetical protein